MELLQDLATFVEQRSFDLVIVTLFVFFGFVFMFIKEDK